MKKKIQALACAAMLAVGGFNVWTAMDGRVETMELQIDGVERLAEGEAYGENNHWEEGLRIEGVADDHSYASVRVYKCEKDGNVKCTIGELSKFVVQVYPLGS